MLYPEATGTVPVVRPVKPPSLFAHDGGTNDYLLIPACAGSGLVFLSEWQESNLHGESSRRRDINTGR